MVGSLDYPEARGADSALGSPGLRSAIRPMKLPAPRPTPLEHPFEGGVPVRLQLRRRRAEQHARATRQEQHREFQLVRSCALLIDAFTAVVLSAVALVSGVLVIGLVAVCWLVASSLMAERAGRVADLVDQRPYLRFGANLLLLVTVAATVAGQVGHVRLAMVAAAVPVGVTVITRSMLSRPRVRAVLGSQAGEAVIVVGRTESAARTIREWADLPLINVVGVCLSSQDADRDQVEGVPVLGGISDVPELAKRMPIDIVAVHDVDQLGGQQLAKFKWGLEDTGTQISIITPLTNTALERLRVRKLGRRLIVDVSYNRPTGMIAQLKCGVERVVAFVALVLLSPMLLAAWLAVRSSSRGPAIFRQTRVREYGATFTMYKLRTMHQDAEERLAELMAHNEVGGGLFKMKSDPRVTRVGRWLRKLSIDELPQLWNVVKGDMSLIGPRPALPSEVATYDEAARRRLTVKPGLTGLWQVSGRSNLTWEESVRIDTDYVDNWRASRDVSIALRTVKAVMTRDGAH